MVYAADNFDSLKATLEQASKIVISSNVSKEQRVESESYFIEFRKSKSPYEFCRFLLETSKEPYVLFQAVSALREATLREWSLLPANLVAELQNFLLSYVVNSACQSHVVSTDKYVQKQILLTLAVFYKRSKLDLIKPVMQTNSSVAMPANMVKDVIELFKTSNVKLKQICCSLMQALLNEFANTTKSTKLGLSSDSHFTAKRSFEQNEFKLLLVFLFETTQSLIESLVQNNITSVKTLDTDSNEMLLQLFTLIDQSFNWEFTSSKHILKNVIVNFNQSNNNSNVTYSSSVLEPTPEFRDFFLNPNLVTLLFQCYELVRDDQDMAHAAIQPIIQLSSLNGPIFKDDESTDGSGTQARLEFLSNFLRCFLSMFSKIQMKDYESFNFACLMENIMSPCNTKKFHRINPQLIEAFFNIVCAYVTNCFKAEKACTDTLDSNKYLESYEKVLIAWMSIKDNLSSDYQPDNVTTFELLYIFKNYSQTVIEAFVHSRLSSYNFEADKENIKLSDDGVDCESIDDDDSAEDDLHRYKEILYSLGEFAKFSLDFCLPMLAKVLNEKYIQLIEVLSRVSNASMEPALLEKHLTTLSEDIHWLLLISGFMLFEVSSEPDRQSIPTEIMNYSIMCSKYVDSNLICKLFSSLNTPNSATNQPAGNMFQQISGNVSAQLIETRLNESDLFDPVVRLVFNSFQLCELETQMFSMNMLSHLSPQVASTLMWFTRELSRSYLFMKEENYTDLSPTLQVLFGPETESSQWVLKFLLRKLYTNFYIWSAENTATSQTAKLLLEIVKHKEMCKILLQNEQFWSISKIAVVNEMPWLLLPSSVKKIIIKSLVVSCSTNITSENNQMQIHFYNTILQPLTSRFEALSQIKHDMIHVETCIKEVMSLIETFNGIIEGASKSIINQLLPFVIPRLQQGVQLYDIYHNYGEIVELILCMFNGVIEKFLPYISNWPDAKNQIYHCFLCLIQVFSRHNSGKRSNEANIEEDYYNDLLLFITLLNTLNNIENDSDDSKFLNNHQTLNKLQNGDNLNSIDIILMGLEFLIPLMNREMLKFQALCIEYFKLICQTAYSNAAKLYSKSFDLFSTLINSIEFGINCGSGTEVVRLSLDCIIPLCNYVYLTKTQQSNYAICLSNLFKTVFDMIFRNAFEMELFEVSSGVLYSFICCFQDMYSMLVSQLIAQYDDENVKQKIIQGFQSLTPANFNFNTEKRNRLKFNSKFNDFCIKTYGLLFIR